MEVEKWKIWEKYEELGEEIKRLENLKKNKRWRAELNNCYFNINNDRNICITEEKNNKTDDYRYKTRNYFKTKEEAEKYLEKIEIYYELMDIAEELNGEEEIDWENEDQNKYYIYCMYDNHKFELHIVASHCTKSINNIYCLSRNFLGVALERIGADRLKKLF